MKIRAQIGMVLNLDKCIGCHTCSVTCKNVWTSRPGMEYAWFNNVETKPGIGYPKEWENQDKWNGGWVRKANGKIEPRQGAKWKLLMRIFANPNMPQIDDYYEPFTFDYAHLQSAPEIEGRADRPPAQPDHRQAHGKDRLGPELGRNPGRRVLQAQQGQELRRYPEGHLRPVRKHLHDVPAAAVRALPESGLRGVVSVGLDLQARGRRHRADRPGQVPRLAHVRERLPVQEDLLQLEVGQGREVHLLLPAHRSRASPRCARETCVGRIRYLGVLLYDADRIQEAASVEHDRDLYQAQLDIFLDPNDPKVIEQARIDGIPDKWMEAARKSPVYKMAVDWKVALPLHPEYRTLPMVWYVPPLSPISAAANAGQMGINGEIPDVKSLRIPVKYLANLLTAGDTAAGGARAGAHAGHARLPARKACGWPHQHGGAGPGPDDAGRGGGDVPRDGDCQLRGPFRDPQHATASTPKTPSTCAAAAASRSATGARTATATPACLAGPRRRTIPIKAEV